LAGHFHPAPKAPTPGRKQPTLSGSGIKPFKHVFPVGLVRQNVLGHTRFGETAAAALARNEIRMSDEARNYVKNLDNSRLRPSEKSFLFFLADYYNARLSSAWPSLQTLAEDTGLSLRYIRRLVERCIELRLISYEPGLGRGNKGCFQFLELDTDTVDPKRGRNEGQNGARKGGQKEGLHDSVIRNEPEPEPELRTKDPHASGALKVWLTVKEQLRTELPADEWQLWVRPTYLLRVMGHHLLLVMPPNNAIIEAACKRKPTLKAKLAEYGFTFGFAKYPDDWQRDQLESQGWEMPPKRKPQREVSV
jgi:hypothetical protein